MGQLKDKIAIITGSGRGQGLVAAKLFAKEGAKIVVNDLDQDSVDSAVESITSAGGSAVGLTGDVSNAEEVQRILQLAGETFGGIDILYNNAGIGYSATDRFGIAMSDVVNCAENDWRRIMDVNVGGVFLFCKYGIPALIKRGGGTVINTASIAALRGAQDAHAYTASKGAILALTRAIAVTYGPQGVRANTICPGVIDTEMIHNTLIRDSRISDVLEKNTPLRRNGKPEDVAGVALFLASDQSRFVTGEAFAVDGGITQQIGVS